MTFTSENPATGEIIWEGEEASSSDIDRALKKARAAFSTWSTLPLEERLDYMRKWQELLTANKEEFALTISRDMGKTLWESRGEVGAMIGKIELSIQAYHERTGTVQREIPGAKAITRHKPHGVIAVFGPFNFPGHLPNGHIVPALIAGNCVVLKPSEQTPLVGEMMQKLWEQVELPDGVLCTLQGGAETGKALATHPDIDGLFFTGSSRTGKILSEAFGKTPEKILALELGGNNPLIVDEVSDLSGAAYATIQSAFITSGQRCTCARRLILPEGEEGDAFLQELVKMSQTVHVGSYKETPEPFYGPQVSKEAADQIYAAYEKLVASGAQVLLPMRRKGEAMLTPAILEATSIPREDEETFGPLLQVIRVPDFDAAIKEANNTRYGLSAGLLSDNEKKWELFLQQIRAGIVNWNQQTTGASGSAPFGGCGLSGNHRPSAYYAADYCAYPVASVEKEKVVLPDAFSPGIGS